jgi:ABC-2 type transport system ATP-binding protein
MNPSSSAASRQPMIKTEGLGRRFGDQVAVEGLTLEVQAGEVFGFLGPNGAGKTTTIRMLTALIQHSTGRAWVAGYELGRQDREIRRRVGILTESPGLYDRLSAAANLAFFARMYEVVDVEAKVERYLHLLGLWPRRHEAAGTFSKGMRHKLAIARALLHEPQVLFLDEPTSGLDPEAARLVREFIEGLKQEGRTIFITTHNLDEADRLCDRLAIFNTRVLAIDTPSALRRRLYGRTVVFHLGGAAEAYRKAIEAMPGIHQVEAVDNKLVVQVDEPERLNPQIVRSLVGAGADVQFVGELRRSLEDVYLQFIRPKRPENGLHNDTVGASSDQG